MPRLAFTVLVLALIVGATAAFAITEALKLERSPVGKARVRAYFSPQCDCRTARARLAFKLRRPDRIDAEVVDEDGQSVRTLATGEEYTAGNVIFRWDGETDAGTIAPDGPYRWRLQFADDGRTIVVPDVFRLDTAAPTAELVAVTPRVLSPDGDGRRDSATVDLSVSETARPIILVDGTPAARGKSTDPGAAEMAWAGTRDSEPLAAGVYVVAVQARDRAGNLSSPSSGLTVRIRYVELNRLKYTAARGGVLRFQVVTDAERIEWSLLRRAKPILRGDARAGAVAVRIPERVRRGRYALRVEANDRATNAVLIVR